MRSAIVHRLVAEAFLPNPANRPFVNHINRNKTDANLSNLEWVTASENIIHAYRINLRPVINTQGERNGFSKLTLNTVREIKKLSLLGTLTQNQIATKFNVSRSTVRDIKLGRRWQQIV